MGRFDTAASSAVAIPRAARTLRSRTLTASVRPSGSSERATVSTSDPRTAGITGWFQRALKSGEGRIRAAGVERDVAFEQPAPNVADVVTAAYPSKYDRYAPSIVGTVVSAEAVKSTLRLVPR